MSVIVFKLLLMNLCVNYNLHIINYTNLINRDRYGFNEFKTK
jgi:hypothetical protein